MPGPFDGLCVVEFGRFIAAPYAAQLLADAGAKVVKVEPLLGDNARQMAPPVLGKHSRELLTQTGMAAEAIDRLIEFGAVISSS